MSIVYYKFSVAALESGLRFYVVVLKRYNMLKIKDEIDETEKYFFQTTFGAVEPKPLDVPFENNEISTTEEYLVKNEVDNTYEVLKRYNMLNIKPENDDAEEYSVEPKPFDVLFKNNKISIEEDYLVKNDVDDTYEVLKRYNMLKIKDEIDETEKHFFETTFGAVETKPLDEPFENNEISTTEEYLVKNEVDNTYEVLKRFNILKIKPENDETEEELLEKSLEVVDTKPLDMKFINNEISTTEECMVKNEVDNNYDIHFPCKATDTSNNTKTMDCSLNKTIENDSEKNIHKLRRFDCNICQRRFITKSNIIWHIAKSHSSTSIEKKAPQKNKVNHRNSRIKKYTQNKDGLFYCGICSRTFSLKSSLRRHWRVHTEKKPFKCDICDKTFGRQSYLKTHERIHTGEKPFKCDVCKKCFNVQSNLKTHEKTHTGEKPFRCVVCGKTFSQQISLKIHKRIHTGEKPYKCVICEKTFIQQSDLKKHARVHTGEKPYKCNVCKKSFIQQPDLKKHARVHTGEKPFKCRVCEKAFIQQSNLKRHARIHTGEKPYKCVICEKTFIQQSCLKKHARVHTGEKPYKCDICQKTFIQQSNLKKHVRIHNGEKPFKCDICKKSFCDQSNLKTHERTHTGEKPYKCVVCEKTFGQQSDLKKHARIHTGEKPFKCDVCEKTFSQKSNLIIHERIHIGGVRYKCSACDKSYGRQGTLKSHQAKAHGP
ncbi:zinc finger protein ZFP2-like isoform X3 [Adelges cooleyi]|uniref:zinc finger protein ZFP2-like isoform X2 n=1 Tax=Adelges cooleyi TaxID=133065 RepID=UPI00217F3259|nr:zinc finger protein ZFP2-like isoform X2 [Adelges cooleyi]XP_050435121.1 zinc finger protein ZFP2-like isoform X3 [Adelges cooleyi]